MSKVLYKQYQLVQSARLELLNYCKQITNEDLSRELESFNNKSIQQLFVHNANVYIHWLVNNALHKSLPLVQNESCPDIEHVEGMFSHVDKLMDEFLNHFGTKLNSTLEIPLAGKYIQTTPLAIFTHVITHEFHHKGQILSMSRLLGYTPIDTDIIRT